MSNRVGFDGTMADTARLVEEAKRRLRKIEELSARPAAIYARTLELEWRSRRLLSMVAINKRVADRTQSPEPLRCGSIADLRITNGPQI